MHNCCGAVVMMTSLSLLWVPALSPAHDAGMHNAGHVGQASGHLVTDGYGRCVTTSAWTEAMALQDCGAKPAPVKAAVIAKAEPKSVTETLRLNAGALFDTDKADIKPAGRNELDAFLSKLNGKNVRSISVTGHTDDRGADAHNRTLSERRAEAVKSYLARGGVDVGKISTRGEGESNPIADNNTTNGRAQNRRVEIEVSVLQ